MILFIILTKYFSPHYPYLAELLVLARSGDQYIYLLLHKLLSSDRLEKEEPPIRTIRTHMVTRRNNSKKELERYYSNRPRFLKSH